MSRRKPVSKLNAYIMEALRTSLYVLVLGGFIAAVSDDGVVAREDAPGVPMLSGGVGEEDLDSLNNSKERFNVRVMFSEKGGAFVSDVRVKVLTGKGSELANTVTDGPILFMKLKPGNYTIKATLGGVTKSQNLVVTSKGMSRFSVIFPVQDSSD